MYFCNQAVVNRRTTECCSAGVADMQVLVVLSSSVRHSEAKAIYDAERQVNDVVIPARGSVVCR